MANHDWHRYNTEKAQLEHVLFTDDNGIVMVSLEVMEEMLTAMGFHKSDGTEYESSHLVQPLSGRERLRNAAENLQT